VDSNIRPELDLTKRVYRLEKVDGLD
jgi:hypothetical protein